MTISCPNCGVAGPNLNCNLHPMPKFGNMTNPCKEIPQLLTETREKDLLAEIGRLSLQLRTAEIQAHALQAKLSDLEADGIIDQMGRKLPLPDHHKDCPHGQSGWAKCTCEELKARDVKLKQAEDGWKVCMQDSYGNRQYECLKCHYVTKWVKDHSELATAKEHACPSPIDRAFDDLMDDDEDDAGPKKCLHGNLECKRCNPTRAIKTPEGNPLLPAADFSRIRIEDNKECGHSECNYQRRTGRTTAMVIKALDFVKVNTSKDVGVVIDVHNHSMKKHIKKLLLHYADEMDVSHGALLRVTLRTLDEHRLRYTVGQLNLRDNALDDAKSFKDLVDEGQELRKKFDKDTAGMRGAPNCPKCGDTGLISYGPGTRGMKRCDCQTRRLVEEDEFTRVMNETYEHLPPRPRDPRQDLEPGDHVRFEIEGIIKERQSAGIFQDEDGDFEPIQYAIKDSINRMTYYVGYHQITKKIGSVE